MRRWHEPVPLLRGNRLSDDSDCAPFRIARRANGTQEASGRGIRSVTDWATDSEPRRTVVDLLGLRRGAAGVFSVSLRSNEFSPHP